MRPVGLCCCICHTNIISEFHKLVCVVILKAVDADTNTNGDATDQM